MNLFRFAPLLPALVLLTGCPQKPAEPPTPPPPAIEKEESVSANLRVLGKVTATSRVYEGGTEGWTSLTTESPENATRTGSKLMADMLGFGDVVKVSESPTILQLGDDAFWQLAQEGPTVQVLFARSRVGLEGLLRRVGGEGWQPVPAAAYPRWFDRFDNDAVGMGMLGWGIMPQDVYADYDWTAKRFRRVLGCSLNETRYVAPGVFDFSVLDWWKAMAEKNGVSYDIYLSEMYPERPKFAWNVTPLPHVIPFEDSLAHDSFFRQWLGVYSEFNPIGAADPYLLAAQRGVSEHVSGDPTYGAHFATPELAGNIILHLTAIGGHPETKAGWHEFLQKVQGLDLAAVSKLYRGDGPAFTSWDEVEVPTMKTFAGWNAQTCVDLRGDWSGMPDAENLGVKEQWYANDAIWPPLVPNDIRIMAYAGKKDQPPFFWMRRNFTVDAEQLKSLRYLHVSMAGWHGTASSIDAYLNGQPLKKLTVSHPITGDNDECFDLGGALKEGENTLVFNTYGHPIPGYIFLSPTGRWSYPSASKELNRLYFDANEFSAWWRVKWAENSLRAYRAGDPEGHPQLIMAPRDYQDMLLPLYRKYGAFAHCTGQSGACWAPWVTSYAMPHGVPISSEPGGAPKTVAGMQRMTSLYALLGNDSVNFLFHPSSYRDDDNGGIGRWVDANLELIKCIGKMEPLPSQVGVLRSVRNAGRLRLAEPWQWDVSRGDLQSVGVRGQVIDPSDLSDPEFISRYPVLIDAGTTLFTEKELSGLEQYVKDGGIFIALHNTGMHTPEQGNAWPISKLSGLKVMNKDRGIGGKIRFTENQSLWPMLRGQEIDGWGMVYDYLNDDTTGDSLALSPVSDDVEVIAEWSGRKPEEGNVAIAMRKIGKGAIVTLGSTFWREVKDAGGRYTAQGQIRPFLGELLKSLGIERASSVDSEDAAKEVFAEEWRSKNGIYDLFLVARVNDKPGEPMTVTPTFYFPRVPEGIREISAAGHPAVTATAVEGGFSLPATTLEPMQLRVYSAPRQDLANAPLYWLKALERRWNALEAVPTEEQPAIQSPVPWFMPLAENWKMLPSDLIWGQSPDAATDWSQAKDVRLGSFDALGLKYDGIAHFQKEVIVPPEWKGRRVSLSFDSPKGFFWGVMPNGRLWINGKPAAMDLKWQMDYSRAIDLDVPEDGKLVFELEVDGRLAEGAKRSRPSGVFGLFSLQADPQPLRTLDIVWEKSLGLGVQPQPVEPGKKQDFLFLESRFQLPSDWPQGPIFMETPERMGWLIINNQLVTVPSHMRALDVSGLLRKDGGENIISYLPSAADYSKPFKEVPPRMRLAVWPDRPFAAK